jgi:hypothetical protein
MIDKVQADLVRSRIPLQLKEESLMKEQTHRRLLFLAFGACLFGAYVLSLGTAREAQGQPAAGSGVQGSASTPLILPGAGSNLNPVGAPSTRLLNSNISVPSTTTNLSSPQGSSLPSLNFGTSSIGRLNPPAGVSGISGIGRIGPPGNQPNLLVNPNLAGPPSLSPAGTITPITNTTTSISSGAYLGGPNGGVNPPAINPTNPASNDFQANPTAGSDLRNPSDNYRP